MRAQERRWRARSLMGVYAAVRREPERGVGAVLRPCTASSTGSRRGSDVLVTITDRPGAIVTRVGGGRSGGSTISTFFNNRVPLPFATSH